MKLKTTLLALAVVIALPLVYLRCAGRKPRQTATATTLGAEPLHQAFHDLTGVIVYDIFSPPQAARVYAYSSVAAYEVLRQWRE